MTREEGVMAGFTGTIIVGSLLVGLLVSAERIHSEDNCWKTHGVFSAGVCYPHNRR